MMAEIPKRLQRQRKNNVGILAIFSASICRFGNIYYPKHLKFAWLGGII